MLLHHKVMVHEANRWCTTEPTILNGAHHWAAYHSNINPRLSIVPCWVLIIILRCPKHNTATAPTLSNNIVNGSSSEHQKDGTNSGLAYCEYKTALRASIGLLRAPFDDYFFSNSNVSNRVLIVASVEAINNTRKPLTLSGLRLRDRRPAAKPLFSICI